MRNSDKNLAPVKFHQKIRIFGLKRLRPWWRDHHWPIVAAIALIALILGYIGFRKHFEAISKPRSFWDLVYLTLQLFTLESGALAVPLNWELEIARFLAPAVAAYTALKALAIIFRVQLQMLRVRFNKDHIVVCGLGKKGLLLAQRFRQHGNKVVVIEQDEGNDMLEQCREYGATVLVGSATDRELLRKAGVLKAKCLISVCGDDGVNAEVAVCARELVRDRKDKALTCIVHIVSPQLCHLLREREIVGGKVGAFRLEFFNIFDSGARSWLQEYPAFGDISDIQSCQPHLLIVGLGRMGESLLVHAAKEWKDLAASAGKKLRITIIDRAAGLKRELLHLRYPQLEKICEIFAKQMDVKSPEFLRADFLFDDHGRCPLTGICICFDDDSFGLSVALALYQKIREYQVPIIVRMTRDAGLAALLRGEDEAQSFSRLHGFGLLDRTCRPDLILAGAHEILAHAIHEEYVEEQQKELQTPETNPYMVSWERLPDSLKESNRRQADHIGLKLKAIHCGIAPLVDWDAGSFEFTPPEIERMAEMEHERWMSERLLEGWTYAPGAKNIEKKANPCLVPWAKLPEEIKERNRSSVRALPSFLAKVDLQIYRLK